MRRYLGSCYFKQDSRCMSFRSDYFGKPSSVNSQSLRATLYCCLNQLCGLYLKLCHEVATNPSEITLQNWAESSNDFRLGGTVHDYWASMLTSDFLGEPDAQKSEALIR